MTRIVVHDYGGYAFPLQLARTMAARGHHVLHLSAVGVHDPRADLRRRPDDPPTLAAQTIAMGAPADRDRFVRRWLQERRYADRLCNRIALFTPDIVLSSNTPLDPQAAALSAAHRLGASFIFWLQDLYSVGIRRLLSKQIPVFGRVASSRFESLERRTLRQSDAVVAITDAFLPTLAAWEVPGDRISVIENWAPLDHFKGAPGSSQWAEDAGITRGPVLLYAGTLGRKHDPTLLAELARSIPDAVVVVVAQGFGADSLRGSAGDISNLILLPLQPGQRIPEVLASADILIALLESDAGEFSVPSKVLSYLAAGRPILASMPLTNLAATTIRHAGAGMVVAAGDRDGFVTAARDLLANPAEMERAGSAGRRYALATFDIEVIADRFEAVMAKARGNKLAGPMDKNGPGRDAQEMTDPI